MMVSASGRRKSMPIADGGEDLRLPCTGGHAALPCGYIYPFIILNSVTMALNAYLWLKSKKQGDIKGSVTQKGREGAIAVHSFHHHIQSPRDAASGQATGKRQ